ncbi:MAG: hypothetical protein KAI74_07605 [Kiritimatiellae bacterium]|nr:hypothetical protein [Kiritimatiellia bacterium]
MATIKVNSAKKTLKLKSATKPAAVAADSDVDTGAAPAGVPIIGAVGGVSSAPVVDTSYTVPAIIAVITTVIFAVMVIIQLMEWQTYSIPTLLQ